LSAEPIFVRAGAAQGETLARPTSASETAAVSDDLATVRLTLAILRDAGVSFADAWPIAVPAPQPPGANASVRLALDATRRSWERAYDGAAPTSGEIAAADLFGYAIADAAEDRGGEIVGVRCG
jgi:hypothetical protein